MKRFLPLLMAVILAAGLLMTGCGSSEAERSEELQKTMEKTYNELSATFSGSTGEYTLVAEYLRSWAKKNEVKVIEDSEHYMVISNPATEGCEKAESIVFQCTVDTMDFTNCFQPVSLALTALLGPEAHGDISLIITETDKGQYVGAASADPEYYDCDHFINLQHSEDIQLYTSGCYEMSADMTADISMKDTAYPNAYAITMTTAGYNDPFTFDGEHYPNPVEVIGSLLANAKSSGDLFQLASFECDSTDGYTPKSATAIVVIDENDVESFTKKFNSSYRSMKNKFEKLEDNFVFTFTETSMPDSVISEENSDNIISLMYTLKTGIYLQDEESGDVIAASDISSISTEDEELELTMTFRSTDEAVLDEMSNVFLTTSGLCDVSCDTSDKHTTWTANEEKGLSSFFIDALGTEENIYTTQLSSSECDVFSSEEAVNMISYRCNVNHNEAALLNLTHFITSISDTQK